jgi:hypothetical protein
MDGNNKKLSPVDPLPPSYLSVALMICPGVQANSVHACNAGNVNDRLDVMLESCDWFVDWLAGIPYQLTNVTWRMEWLVLVVCVTIANKIFLVDNIRECLYPTLHERKTLLPSHHAIAGCAKGIQTLL